MSLKDNTYQSTPPLPVPVRNEGILDHFKTHTYSAHDLFEEVISRNPNTKLAYLNDLRNFSEYCGETDPETAMMKLLELNQGQANHLISKWRDDMFAGGLAPATLNRRLAAIRSVVRIAQFRGMINWKLSVKGVSNERYRSTEGPGRENVQKMIEYIMENKKDPIRSRDIAIIRMLFSMGLRRNEVSTLDMADIDLDRRKAKVKRKGKPQRIELSIPKSTAEAIAGWVEHRGNMNGPLFVHFSRDNTTTTRRLADNGLFKVIREIGQGIGVKTSPHRIRHTSITEAIRNSEKHGIRIDELLQFSGHRNLETMLIYRDNLRNVQGQVADYVDAALDGDSRKPDIRPPDDAARFYSYAIDLYFKGTKEQKDKAMEWAVKAAERGNLNAALLAGDIARDHLKDFERAVKWYTLVTEKEALTEIDKVDVEEALSKLVMIYQYDLRDEVMKKFWEERLQGPKE